MTSQQKRVGNCSIVTSKRPHFSKIILENTIKDKKLSIPRMFVRKYGSSLSSQVLFKVPSGAEWQVELSKCDEINYLVSSIASKKDEKLKEPKREETRDEDGISVQFTDEASLLSGSHSMESKMKKIDSIGKANRAAKSPDLVPLNGTRFSN